MCKISAGAPHSKEAFEFMKRITKYNQFAKRDGEIISKIKLDDGTILANPEDVNKTIIGQLERIKTSNAEPK